MTIPLWYSDPAEMPWVEPEEFESPSYAHWKITITKMIPEHDGYCSDAGCDGSEPIGYVTETFVRAYRLDTWEFADFNPLGFSFKNGCSNSHWNGGGAGSGYCDYLTHVTITSIERFA